MDSLLILRVKYVLADRYIEIVTTVLVLLGICLVLLFTNVATPAVAVSPLADENSHVQQTTHSAGVSQDTTVTITNTTRAFTEGEELTDKSLYPMQNASDPIVTTQGEGQNTVVTSIDIHITYAVSARDDAATPFYTKEEHVASKDINSHTGSITTPIDIHGVFATKEELKDEFGQNVLVTPTIQSTVTYQYSGDETGTLTDTVSVTGEITRLNNLYALPTHSDQARHELGDEPDDSFPLLESLLSALVSAFIVLFTATVLIARQNDLNDLGRQIQAKRYDDWVTGIESYTPPGEPIVVQVKSMAGLVNLAIDIRERVLYTEKLDEYIVVDGNTMYKYQPENSSQTGATEYFGFSQDEIQGIPEFDSNGDPMTQPNASNTNPFIDMDTETEQNEKE